LPIIFPRSNGFSSFGSTSVIQEGLIRMRLCEWDVDACLHQIHGHTLILQWAKGGAYFRYLLKNGAYFEIFCKGLIRERGGPYFRY
jgi:hypothetical protein